MIARLKRLAKEWRQWSVFLIWGGFVVTVQDRVWAWAVPLGALLIAGLVWVRPRSEPTPAAPYVSDPEDVAKLREVNELSRRRADGSLAERDFEAELARIFKQ